VTGPVPMLTAMSNSAIAVSGLRKAIDHRAGADALVAARLLTLRACQGNWGNALYAAASDGYGEAVTDRRDLVPALSRALHAVQAEHRQAVVNVSYAD
jgi:hypothetical protein